MSDLPTLIYVAGHARVGSTIVDASLDRLDGVASLGEISHLPTFLLRDLDCTCGEPISACSAWSAVVAEASTFDLASIEQTTRAVESSSLPAWRVDVSPDYHHFWTRVLQVAQRDRDARYLVDSSKSLVQFRRRRLALSQCGFDVRVLHMTRNARAVARSSRSGPGDVLGERWTPRLAGARAMVGLTLSNVQARIDRAMVAEATISTLREFTAAPDAKLQRWASELDLETGVDLQPLTVGHAVGGNRHRHTGATELEVDESAR